MLNVSRKLLWFPALLCAGLFSACAPKQETETAINFSWNEKEVLAARKKYGPMSITLPSNYCYMIHVQGQGIGLWQPEAEPAGCPVGRKPQGLGKMAGLFAKGVVSEFPVLSGSNRVFHMLGIPKGTVSTDNPSVVVPNDCSGLLGDFKVPAGTTDFESVKPSLSFKNSAGLVGNLEVDDVKLFGYAKSNIEAGVLQTIELSPMIDDITGVPGTDYSCGGDNNNNWGGLVVANGAAITGSRYESVYLFHPSGVSEYCLTLNTDCSADCTGTTPATGDWNNLMGPVIASYDLDPVAAGDGEKKIYFRFRGPNLPATSCKLGGTVILDRASPTITLGAPSNGATFSTDSVTFTGFCSESGKVRIKTTGSGDLLGLGVCDAGSFTIPGDLGSLPDNISTSITAEIFDAAGNSGSALISITRDLPTSAASLGLNSIDSGAIQGNPNFGKVPINTPSFINTLVLQNNSGVGVSAMTATVSAPFFFEGGTFPGTTGTLCGSTLASGFNCKIRIYAQRATTGIATGNLSVTFNNGVGVVTKIFPLSVEFYSSTSASAKRLVMVFPPGEVFMNGMAGSDPIKDLGSQPVVKVRPTSISVYAVDENNYKVSSYTKTLEVMNTNNAPISPKTSSMVAGAKTGITAIIPSGGSPSADFYAYSDYLVPADRNISATEYCSASPMGSDGFQDGDGSSAANAYIICTAAQLNSISAIDAPGKFYAIKTNLNGLGALSSSLGDDCSTGLRGNFNGNGYRMDLDLQPSGGTMCGGLFGKINSGGTVENLQVYLSNFAHAAFSAGSYSGAIAGEMNGTIRNVQVEWNAAPASNNIHSVGGLAGKVGPSGMIEDSEVILPSGFTIRGTGDVGGIAGFVNQGWIRRVGVSPMPGVGVSPMPGVGIGTIEGALVSGSVGGLIGLLSGGTLEASRAGQYGNNLLIYNGAYDGGLVGRMNTATQVPLVTNSYAYANIDNPAVAVRGGIVGQVDTGNIQFSFYSGNNLNVSSIGTPGDLGGVAGKVEAPGIILHSYYNDDVIAPISAVGNAVVGSTLTGVGSLDNLPDINGFVGWDFSSNWMKSRFGFEDGYPRLLWEKPASFKWANNSNFSNFPDQPLLLRIPTWQFTETQFATAAKGSGKWYWEIKVFEGAINQHFGIGRTGAGLLNDPYLDVVGEVAESFALTSAPNGTATATRRVAGVITNLPDTARPRYGDTLRFLLDLGNGSTGTGTLRVFRGTAEILAPGGGALFTGIPLDSSTKNYRAMFGISAVGTGSNHEVEFNFGDSPFDYSIPSGYLPYRYLGAD